MKFAEIEAQAERLRRERIALPEPGMSNYKQVLAAYERMINDMIVLIRNIAENLKGLDDNA